MNISTIFLMIISGLMIGLFPLIMNKSGLTGAASAATYAMIGTIILVPFVLYQGLSLEGTNWWLAVVAGALGAFGLWIFFGGLNQAAPESVGRFFTIMLLAQISVPALYQVLKGGTDPKIISGLALAFVAAYLLS